MLEEYDVRVVVMRCYGFECAVSGSEAEVCEEGGLEIHIVGGAGQSALVALRK